MGLKNYGRNPRLLIILNRFVIGGQAVDTIPLAWYLKDRFEILILYGEKEKDEIEPDFLLRQYPGLRLKKMRHLRRSINPITDVFAFFGVFYVITSFKADIVHTHGAKSGFIGRLAAWLAGVPVIIHSFHGHFFHSYFSKTGSALIAFVERTVGRITTCAVALSNAQKDELVEKYKILPSSKIKVIQLGFAFNQRSRVEVERKAFRDKYCLAENDVAVGIVGRIVPVKNHSFFIEVLQQVRSRQPVNAPAFFIIGDGDVRQRVEREMQQKNILFNNRCITQDNRVVFTSWLTEMYEVMNGLDIIVLTSFNEGTPLSIIEAEFFRRPVVATNVGGVKDTMVDGKSGFLIESNNAERFASKLCELIDNRELREQMGAAGYRFASMRFSKQREVSETKDFYLGLLAKKGYSF